MYLTYIELWHGRTNIIQHQQKTHHWKSQPVVIRISSLRLSERLHLRRLRLVRLQGPEKSSNPVMDPEIGPENSWKFIGFHVFSLKKKKHICPRSPKYFKISLKFLSLPLDFTFCHSAFFEENAWDGRVTCVRVQSGSQMLCHLVSHYTSDPCPILLEKRCRVLQRSQHVSTVVVLLISEARTAASKKTDSFTTVSPQFHHSFTIQPVASHPSCFFLSGRLGRTSEFSKCFRSTRSKDVKVVVQSHCVAWGSP